MTTLVDLTDLRKKLENEIRDNQLILDGILMVDVPQIVSFIETLPDKKFILKAALLRESFLVTILPLRKEF